MRQRRMRQSNLFGPAGLVSADDGEAIEMCQQGFAHSIDESALVVMGGRETESVEHMDNATTRFLYEHQRGYFLWTTDHYNAYALVEHNGRLARDF